MPTFLREPARSIPVMGSFDSVVLGGGPAGIAAAIASARGGAKTLLIEQTGCLGGMSTSGMVPVFAPVGHTDRPAIRGILQEILERLRSIDGVGRNVDTLGWIPLDLEKLKLVYDQMVIEAGAEVLFFTMLADIRRRGRRITHAIVQNKGGRQAITGKYFIDATGDADAAARAGVAFEKGDSDGSMQPASACYVATGIDLPVYRAFLSSIKDRVAWWLERQKAGDIPTIKDTEYRGLAPFEVTPSTVGINFAHLFKVDGTNPQHLSRAIMNGRRMAHAFMQYARKNIPGMQNARIVATASLPGIRETRRIKGRSRLTIDDFKQARHHPDDVACYDYPVDVHNSSLDKSKVQKFHHDMEHLVMANGQTYGIPFSCLLPRELDNLAVAGRSLSADRAMHGSVRVMPACFAMGQAAGQAAAMARRAGMALYQVNIRQLQKKLVACGVRLI
jgi:hypothetical protein